MHPSIVLEKSGDGRNQSIKLMWWGTVLYQHILSMVWQCERDLLYRRMSRFAEGPSSFKMRSVAFCLYATSHLYGSYET